MVYHESHVEKTTPVSDLKASTLSRGTQRETVESTPFNITPIGRFCRFGILVRHVCVCVFVVVSSQIKKHSVSRCIIFFVVGNTVQWLETNERTQRQVQIWYKRERHQLRMP